MLLSFDRWLIAARELVRLSSTRTSSVPTRTPSPMTSAFIGPTPNASAMRRAIPLRACRCLIREGILDEKGINRLEKEVEDDLQIAVDRALAAPPPKPETITNYVYSPDIDPTSSAFETQPAFSQAPAADGKRAAPKTMADLINATLRDEMRRDGGSVSYGEVVAGCG